MKKTLFTHSIVFLMALSLSGCETDTMATFRAIEARLFPDKFPLSFDTKCCTAERQFVWDNQNLAEFADVQEKVSGRRDISIGVIQNDLNEDGQMDLLAQVYSPAFCGSGGCTLHIYIAEGQGAYREIQASSNTQARMNILDRKTNGMKDLVFAGRQGERCIWKWNQAAYDLDHCERQ